MREAGFVSGDRLDDPGNPGLELNRQIESVALDLEANSISLIVDTFEDAVIGTDGDDQIIFPVFDIGRTDGVVIAGLEGTDDIEMSIGEDVLVFRKGDGQDTIEDFNLAEDMVVLYGFNVPLDPQLVEVNGDFPFTFDTTVNFGGGDSITFKGLDLDDVDFLLDNNVVPSDAFDDLLIA